VLALYVLPKFQGQEIGSALLETTIQWIGEHKRISLEVAKYNSAAINFYSKRGFGPTGDILNDPSLPPPEIAIPHLGMARPSST